MRSNVAVSKRTITPTTAWPCQKQVANVDEPPSRDIAGSEWRDLQTDQILSRQPPLSDEVREDGFSNARDHLDRHRRKHDAGAPTIRSARSPECQETG